MHGDNWVWTTKDGKDMHIQEMETRHILNCMRMIEKADFTSSGMIGGGYDSDDMWCEEWKSDYTPVYNNMVLELRLRNLEVNHGRI